MANHVLVRSETNALWQIIQTPGITDLVIDGSDLPRADSASLAAADTIRGLASGVPCVNAELIAVSNGVFLDSCRIVGTDVSIGLTKFVGLSEISVDSVAGSPSD
jgi:hypothetical protein